MILDSTHCDEIEQVQTIILRDQGLQKFDDNRKDGLKMDDLVNCECIYLSHNDIKHLDGIGTISTLMELNLSFNRIHDITPLQDLVLLEKLWLNRNSVLSIEALKNLKRLK